VSGDVQPVIDAINGLKQHGAFDVVGVAAVVRSWLFVQEHDTAVPSEQRDTSRSCHLWAQQFAAAKNILWLCFRAQHLQAGDT
jgi:hypothetical protein